MIVTLLRAQQFGEQMQRSNPELFNELRGHAQSAVDEHLLEYGNEDEDPKTGQNRAKIELLFLFYRVRQENTFYFFFSPRVPSAMPFDF